MPMIPPNTADAIATEVDDMFCNAEVADTKQVIHRCTRPKHSPDPVHRYDDTDGRVVTWWAT